MILAEADAIDVEPTAICWTGHGLVGTADLGSVSKELVPAVPAVRSWPSI